MEDAGYTAPGGAASYGRVLLTEGSLSGTNIFEARFHLYTVGRGTIHEAWSANAGVRAATPDGSLAVYTVGVVKDETPFAGGRVKFTYLTCDVLKGSVLARECEIDGSDNATCKPFPLH
jgi:hypothetical protein